MFDDTIYIPGNEYYNKYWSDYIDGENKIENLKNEIKMKELICINPKNYKLTLNNKYLVVIDEGDTIKIINDSNKTVRYYKDLFQEVEEEVIHEPEPVIVRTEQDLIDSIASEGSSTIYIDFDNKLVKITNNLSIINNNTDFSCGINNITNIGSQIEEIYESIEETASQNEEDLPLLTKAVIKHHFKNYIKYKSNNGMNAGIYLMSCNIDGDGLDEEIVDILNEISDFNTEPEINPNSNNEIKLWGFYKSNLNN
jgi:hypothetical protein